MSNIITINANNVVTFIYLTILSLFVFKYIIFHSLIFELYFAFHFTFILLSVITFVHCCLLNRSTLMKLAEN